MRRLAGVIACVVFIVLVEERGRAQASSPTEYAVKAAYLYNFGKFVQWASPERRGSRTFDICVLGMDPFGAELDRVVSGAVMGGRTVQARRLLTPAEALGCHILFIVGGDERQVTDVIGVLGRADVLTVSDTPQFVRLGGMIQFVLQGARVRFEVNLARAQQTGLTLSSELLRVATAVRRDEAR